MKYVTLLIAFVVLTQIGIAQSKSTIPSFYRPVQTEKGTELIKINAQGTDIVGSGIADKKISSLHFYFNAFGQLANYNNETFWAHNPDIPAGFTPSENQVRKPLLINGTTILSGEYEYLSKVYTNWTPTEDGGVVDYISVYNEYGRKYYYVTHETISKIYLPESSTVLAYAVTSSANYSKSSLEDENEYLNHKEEYEYDVYYDAVTQAFVPYIKNAAYYAKGETYDHAIDGWLGLGRGDQLAYKTETQNVFFKSNYVDSIVYVSRYMYNIQPDTSVLGVVRITNFTFSNTGVAARDSVNQTIRSRTFSNAIVQNNYPIISGSMNYHPAPADFLSNPNERFDQKWESTSIFENGNEVFKDETYFVKNQSQLAGEEAVDYYDYIRTVNETTPKSFTQQTYRNSGYGLVLTGKNQSWYQYEYSTSRLDSSKNWLVQNNNLTLVSEVKAFEVRPNVDSLIHYNYINNSTILTNGFVDTFAESYPTQIPYPNDGQTVANETDFGIPNQIKLEQNFPNPFNPSTQIQFTIPVAGRVRLEVFDVLGRLTHVITNSELYAGTHTFQLNASDWASGIYFYRLQLGNQTITKKMLLIK
ncbi:T9SS type A sorting domain-containing protein [bacterium]|nr:MAG: T9SS type A sorting domain-containing protein [bacterium]